jgi:hypothetical protein
MYLDCHKLWPCLRTEGLINVHFLNKTSHLQKLGDKLYLKRCLALYHRTQTMRACYFPQKQGKSNSLDKNPLQTKK